MPVRLSQAALHINAQRVAGLAEATGLSLAVALKTPFARQPVLAALHSAVQAPYCVFSTEALSMMPQVPRDQLTFVGLATPHTFPRIVARCESSLHTSPETISAAYAAALASGRPHAIWLGYRTSDDSEGIPHHAMSEAITWYADHCRAPLYLAGLLANWGCAVEHPPQQKEINSLFDLADEIAASTGVTGLSVSIGGSVLLPDLSRVRRRRAVVHLRVGEAILCGTVPGASVAELGLVRPFSLTAEVVEVLPSTARAVRTQRVLLNRGSLDLEIGDCVISNGRMIRSSTEMTVAELDVATASTMLGRSVTIGLGFKSSVRALSRSRRPLLADVCCRQSSIAGRGAA